MIASFFMSSAEESRERRVYLCIVFAFNFDAQMSIYASSEQIRKTCSSPKSTMFFYCFIFVTSWKKNHKLQCQGSMFYKRQTVKIEKFTKRTNLLQNNPDFYMFWFPNTLILRSESWQVQVFLGVVG